MRKKKYNLGINSLIWTICYSLKKVEAKLKYKVFFEGAEKIPKQGTAIIMPKHQYGDDIILTAMLINESTGRKPYFIMKHDLAESILSHFPIKSDLAESILDYCLIKSGGIPINRENTRESVQKFKFARKKADEGNIVVNYSEGTRVKEKMGEVHEGAVRLWQKYPIIPIGLDYKKRKKLRLRKEVYVRVGNRINGKDEDPKKLTEIITKEMVRLSGLG